MPGATHEEIEDLFSHLEVIAPALASFGILILAAGIMEKRNSKEQAASHTPLATAKRIIATAAKAVAPNARTPVARGPLSAFVVVLNEP